MNFKLFTAKLRQSACLPINFFVVFRWSVTAKFALAFPKNHLCIIAICYANKWPTKLMLLVNNNPTHSMLHFETPSAGGVISISATRAIDGCINYTARA